MRYEGRGADAQQDVTFVEAEQDIDDEIDAAYRGKYSRSDFLSASRDLQDHAALDRLLASQGGHARVRQRHDTRVG